MVRRILSVVVLAGLLATAPAGTWAAVSPESAGVRGLEMLQEIEAALTDLAERVSPAVVSIAPSSSPDLSKERFRNPRGAGSGVIVSPDGFIVTNNHVVGDAEVVEVRIHDGTKYEGRVVGKDSDTDLALIKVSPRGRIPAATLGNSEEVKIGQWALAVGNPFGLDRTVTLGVVSGIGRQDINLSRYENYIQTDSSIFPGNSGGPLFNLKGEIIGINTAVINSVQGIGFAIPSNMVKQVVHQLRVQGKVVRGWLGVGIQQVTAELGKKFGVEEGQGVLVNEVFENDPAARSGIQPGDIITSVDGTTVESPKSLSRVIAGLKPGDTAHIEVIRDRERIKLDVAVTERRDARVVSALPRPSGEDKLGLHVEDPTPELVQQFKLGDSEGVVISKVDQGSLAQTEGLRAGDLIKELNRQDVASAQQFSKAMAQIKRGETILLRVLRESRAFYVVLRKTES